MRTTLLASILLFVSISNSLGQKDIELSTPITLTKTFFSPLYADSNSIVVLDWANYSNKLWLGKRKTITGSLKGKELKVTPNYGKPRRLNYFKIDSIGYLLYYKPGKKDWDIFIKRFDLKNWNEIEDKKLLTVNKSIHLKLNMDVRVKISNNKKYFSLGLVEMEKVSGEKSNIFAVNLYVFDKQANVKKYGETYIEPGYGLGYLNSISKSDFSINLGWDISCSNDGEADILIGGRSKFSTNNSVKLFELGNGVLKETMSIDLENDSLEDLRLFYKDRKLNTVLIQKNSISWIKGHELDDRVIIDDLGVKDGYNHIDGYEIVNNRLVLLTREYTSERGAYAERSLQGGRFWREGTHFTFSNYTLYSIDNSGNYWNLLIPSHTSDVGLGMLDDKGLNSTAKIEGNHMQLLWTDDIGANIIRVDLQNKSTSEVKKLGGNELLVLSKPINGHEIHNNNCITDNFPTLWKWNVEDQMGLYYIGYW